ncbi:MAG: F0F1 ATP synthase subunit B, partial [Propionicimonas sp.]|nr:F0F1 ATP synthase subunit B [Propionicimonas sp.]
MLPLEGEGPLGPLLPEHLSELFAGIALFLVVWWVVAKKVVPMFEATYAERTAEISGGIENAEAAQAEAAAALAEYKAQLASAREEAAKIREDAKTQAASIAAEIRQQAQDESARMLATAIAQIDAERALVVHQLRGEIG